MTSDRQRFGAATSNSTLVGRWLIAAVLAAALLLVYILAKLA